MLISTEKLKEIITFKENIHIIILDVCDNHVKFGIEAPQGISVIRAELTKARRQYRQGRH